jgi:hypothetical protein
MMLSGVMLRSNVFSRITAYAGILAGAAGIVAVVLGHILVSEALFVLVPSLPLVMALEGGGHVLGRDRGALGHKLPPSAEAVQIYMLSGFLDV